jgi:hypothetical protein
VNHRRKDWPTPETGVASRVIETQRGGLGAVYAVADLYATRPGLCEATRGHYPPRFSWWLERWVRESVCKWGKDPTPVQRARRELVLAALARVDWDTLADYYAKPADRYRVDRKQDNEPARGAT